MTAKKSYVSIYEERNFEIKSLQKYLNLACEELEPLWVNNLALK